MQGVSSLKYVILIGVLDDISNDLGRRHKATGNNMVAETHYNLTCQHTYTILQA